ncbi:MAG: quinolinate synthase NadA [Candidatus Lokiarchaeota archaeon]|nr:quinolinate synthase NadA [Candidatus Lokiarchaeota archaeon]
MKDSELMTEISILKKKKDVTILAHYYQSIEIQNIADYLGDSLELSKIAKEKTKSVYIIFAGVDFMAETASILNQDKHILLPNPESCCPMAAYLDAEMVREYKKAHSGLPVVTYVNSTAEVKAESDVCCTSSNAVKVVKSIAKEFDVNSVLFGPDSNLADYAEQQSGIKCIKMPEEGHCYVHSQISVDDFRRSRDLIKEGLVLVHPECVRAVRELADFVGSTAQMYNRVKNSKIEEDKFIIGTEDGLIRRMAEDFPDKQFYPIRDKLICYNMKKHTLELIKHVLENLDDPMFEVKVLPKIAKKAIFPLEKMLQIS